MFICKFFVFLLLVTLWRATRAVQDAEELGDYRPIHERPQCSLTFLFKDTSTRDSRHATGGLVHPYWVLTGRWQLQNGSDIEDITIRCGSLCLFEKGHAVKWDGYYRMFFAQQDIDLQVGLVRLATPYVGTHTSDLAFIASLKYMPDGTNRITGEVEHSLIAGFMGARVNWVGHRIRGLRVRFVTMKECERIYHSTETASKNDYGNCYTESGCTLSWWSWWPWAWRSCPSFVTTEKYDEGAGVYPLGTNIMTTVIATNHGFKEEIKLPMGTNIQLVQASLLKEIRTNTPDEYADWPEFDLEGVQ